MNFYPIIWLAAIIIFAIAEASTVQLISIWFALGSVFAFFASFFEIPFYWQILIFCAVSGILLIATRPLVKKAITRKAEKTNADRVVGEFGVVLSTIDNIRQTGRVKVMGLDWSARTVDNTVVSEGAVVEILEIQGVKLIVKEKQEAHQN